MASAPNHIDPTGYLDDLLAQASPDLMRQMLQNTINLLLSAQADQVCGAEYGTTSDTRTNRRNGLLLPRPRHPRGHRRRRRAEAAAGLLLPRLAAGTPHPRRIRPDQCRGHRLPERRVHPTDG